MRDCFHLRMWMRRLDGRVLGTCLVIVLGLIPVPSHALDSVLPRQHHAWGRFKQGSWKRVRVISQTLDEHGAVSSQTTTETTSTLVEVSDTGYAVKVETVVNVAGKCFRAPTRIIRRGFDGQQAGQKVVVRQLGPGHVEIEGREVPSEVRRVIIDGEGAKQVVTMHYSDSVSPYVLSQEVVVTDAANHSTRSTTMANAIAVNVPHKVLSEVKQTSEVKTVHHTAHGEIVTLEVYCQEVPGAVVRHESKEFDPQGRLVRTNALELVAYGTVQQELSVTKPPRRHIFLRRRRR